MYTSESTLSTYLDVDDGHGGASAFHDVGLRGLDGAAQGSDAQ